MKTIITSNIFFGLLLLSNLFYIDAFGEDYQGISPGDSIRLLYSPHIDINGLRLALIVDRETNLIQIDFSPYFFNQTKSGTIALMLPYQGTIDENTGWEMKSFDQNTVLIKKYECSEDKQCIAFPREFVSFIVNGKLDSKIGDHHSVGFQIISSAPPRDEYDYILEFKDHREHYELGFNKIQSGKAILIVENTAINLVSNPQAVLDRFENSNTGYENLQFVWDISKIDFVLAEYDVKTKPTVLAKEVEGLTPAEQVDLLPIIQENVGIAWDRIIEPIVIGIIAGFIVLLVNRFFDVRKT